ncbi:MAG: hypothetical protein RBU37_09285 [Myxococcota bacterium]|nr:hypothetical protein [Myxococcota bacterium]
MKTMGEQARRPIDKKFSMLLRAFWGGLAFFSGALTLLWLLSAALMPAPQPWCVRSEQLRGVYHLHAQGHDGVDRSSRLAQVAELLCLDFIVVSEHQGQPSMRKQQPSTLILDGAEWTVGRHHHGQLIGHFEPVEDEALSRFRVLNHGRSSGVSSTAALTQEEWQALRSGELAIEISNVARWWRQAPWAERWRAAAIGLQRMDLFLAALSRPGPDVGLWEQAMQETGRALPMLCGSDAHGGLVDYPDAMRAAVLVLARGTPRSREAIAARLMRSEFFCVNETMGALRSIEQGLDPARCVLSLQGDWGDAQWRLIHNGRELERGREPAEWLLSEDGFYRVELWKDVDFSLWGSLPRLWAFGGAVSRQSSCRLGTRPVPPSRGRGE